MAKSKRSIEEKHAAIAARRREEKAADPTCDFGAVIELMSRAATELAALPEEAEFSMKALDRLEEARHHAIRLKMEIEAIFEIVNGRNVNG